MTKKELKENLLRRIKHLSSLPVNDSYDNGFKQACLQIMEMIEGYK